jgi:hypothetical protein
VKPEGVRPKTEDRGPNTDHALGANPALANRPDGRAIGETCDHCGAEALTWRQCKLICEKCGNIVKSCADL